MNYINGQHLIQLFEQYSPKRYALEGDRIGLQVGTLNKRIKKVMVALDVLSEVVEEAIANNIDLIIAHHPIIYRPLTHIHIDEPEGKLIQKLIKHDIAVYVAHTNLDVAHGGVNDLLADALNLRDCEVLVPTTSPELRKLAVFVPEENASQLRQALGDAGAGSIGNYSHCSYSSKGTGSFRPEANSNPHIGEHGQQEFVDEVKIEVIYPVHIEKQVLRAMLKAHPYEEVAYDLYPLANEGEQFGLGRIGYLREEIPFKQLVEQVKQAFSIEGVRAVGSVDRVVGKVAILGGDGNKYMRDAVRQGADVYITGDVYYHVAHDAQAVGLNMIDPGHNIEKVMKEGVKAYLEEVFEKHRFQTEVVASKVNTDPFTFL